MNLISISWTVLSDGFHLTDPFLDRCALVECADELAAQSQDVAVVCIYLRHDEQLTAWEITLEVIVQLVQHSLSLPGVSASVRKVFERHERMYSKPSFSELTKLLHTILGHFRKASIFVDGLDEMKSSVQIEMAEILSCADAHILIASRRLSLLEDEVEELRGKLEFVDVVAEEDDLDLYIASMFRLTPGFKKLLNEYKIKDKVIQTIKEKAGGM